jgi:hypothetical protein
MIRNNDRSIKETPVWPLQQLGEDLPTELLQALRDLRFGSVEIVIHDSRIVQIERREKWRFDSERSSNVR